jgi:hypothetical protein
MPVTGPEYAVLKHRLEAAHAAAAAAIVEAMRRVRHATARLHEQRRHDGAQVNPLLTLSNSSSSVRSVRGPDEEAGLAGFEPATHGLGNRWRPLAASNDADF